MWYGVFSSSWLFQFKLSKYFKEPIRIRDVIVSVHASSKIECRIYHCTQVCFFLAQGHVGQRGGASSCQNNYDEFMLMWCNFSYSMLHPNMQYCFFSFSFSVGNAQNPSTGNRPVDNKIQSKNLKHLNQVSYYIIDHDVSKMHIAYIFGDEIHNIIDVDTRPASPQYDYTIQFVCVCRIFFLSQIFGFSEFFSGTSGSISY